MVAPTGASQPGWRDEREVNIVSIQAGENDFHKYSNMFRNAQLIYFHSQFSAQQIQAKSFLNYLQPDKFGKL